MSNTDMATDRLPDMPQFIAAVKVNNHGLHPMTWYRYIRGELPPFAYFLLANPHLAEALAADARALASQPLKQAA